MTPKEKTIELVKKFTPLTSFVHNEYGLIKYIDSAKKCALIAVDEILKSEPRTPSNVDWDDVGGTHQYYYEAQREEANKYWQDVKQEIEKL